MSNQEFYYWLLGFYTLDQPSILTAKQLTIIQNHLNLVKEIENELNSFVADVNALLTYFTSNKDETSQVYRTITTDIHQLLTNATNTQL